MAGKIIISVYINFIKSNISIEDYDFNKDFFIILQAEVIFLGQLKHPHLVNLIGYCCEDDHRLLVYEYMPLGNLEDKLFRSI